MSGSKQPFTEHVARAKNSSGGTIWLWILGAMLVALILLVLSLRHTVEKGRKEGDVLRDSLNESITNLANSRAEIEKGRAEVAALQARITGLEQEKLAVAQRAHSLEDDLRSQLESKDVTISKLQGRLTVNIMDRILFDSGEAVLKPDGEAVLQRVATFLGQHPELKIHVVGHTDNVPIRPAARARFSSNWELSAARALAAVRFLTESAGLDPRRAGAVGYGEYRPIADNATAEGRAQNRRIAIVILPDELVGADASASAGSADATPGAAVPP